MTTKFINLRITTDKDMTMGGTYTMVKGVGLANTKLAEMHIQNGNVIYSTLSKGTEEYNDLFDMLMAHLGSNQEDEQ
ncbi:hypothetical protein [Aeromonas hydrophila]|uniref:hypothetical protein n=1 Tax=Aeromonas hydrophila TaxID=644 RepID=UPI003D234D73